MVQRSLALETHRSHSGYDLRCPCIHSVEKYWEKVARMFSFWVPQRQSIGNELTPRPLLATVPTHSGRHHTVNVPPCKCTQRTLGPTVPAPWTLTRRTLGPTVPHPWTLTWRPLGPTVAPHTGGGRQVPVVQLQVVVLAVVVLFQLKRVRLQLCSKQHQLSKLEAVQTLWVPRLLPHA